ncbi:Oxysterol-binding protein [Wickerhamomyces ciferrii]|uniref:Oxysterol-binding protein n=1 Tax=Wickerhamomyces ciferrii (strain ATCC 14091 / BCRC 22168 / CBS 111 / JCM 3599 / NBRC 0793 / NRRL Y-1031 F-60-10) TaxID=1206466 RepID=K0KZU8_WICCF|nr:Oxysterol-binding protein [Wickerhamomyces ciferrii]CCH46869.1 Oxysterol-binding protein [Wickerhamomyces ciferrii]
MSNPASSSSWTSFLKSIASYNGDLSSLTAPPFILSPTSLVEYSQFWGEHPDLLIAPNFIKDDSSNPDEVYVERILAVTKWFISTLRSQYCSRNESLGSEKKPLNPFLGELFLGKWNDSTSNNELGETILLSEQVSHHPPVTAYTIFNDQNNVELQGYNGIRSSISTTSMNVKQFGHAILKFKDLNEEFLITLPPLHIEGLLVASPFVELEGKTIIQSSSGYISIVEFSGRGYFSGKKNSFKARVFKDSASSANKDNALYTIQGQWSGKSTIYKGSSSSNSKNSTEFYDAQAKNPEHLIVKPIENQGELESRKAWLKVSEAIKQSKFDLIHKEKSLIENEQRELRKKEQELGIKWETRWFKEFNLKELSSNINETSDPLFNLSSRANLSRKNVVSGTLVGEKDDKGDDYNHWRFVRENWDNEEEYKV